MPWKQIFILFVVGATQRGCCQFRCCGRVYKYTCGCCVGCRSCCCSSGRWTVILQQVWTLPYIIWPGFCPNVVGLDASFCTAVRVSAALLYCCLTWLMPLVLLFGSTQILVLHSIVRAAKNIHYFFGAQVHVSPDRTVFGKRITPLKSSSWHGAFHCFFVLFRMFLVSLLSINRKTSIRFASKVRISGVTHYNGKRQVS